jgi:hypothetical protein
MSLASRTTPGVRGLDDTPAFCLLELTVIAVLLADAVLATTE